MDRPATQALPQTPPRAAAPARGPGRTPRHARTFPRASRRRGFSFTEVLFAVMILGVGFIMVAAIFPVAIQQSRTTAEETTAAAVARGGANFFEKVATNSAMPATNNIVVSANFDGDGSGTSVNSDGRTLARALQGSTIAGADTRYAWVPFYRRAGNPADQTTWNSFAQVFMIPVLARNESEFKGAPRIYDNAGQANVVVNIIDGDSVTAGAPDRVVFPNAPDRPIPSEGAYLIIADATGLGGHANWDTVIAPQIHGRIYRLGNPIPGPDPDAPPEAWELMPGFDFDPIRVDADNDPTTGNQQPTPFDGKEFVVQGDGDLNGVRVFIVGRGVDPNNPGNWARPNREGAAQDVGAYTTFVNVR